MNYVAINLQLNLNTSMLHDFIQYEKHKEEFLRQLRSQELNLFEDKCVMI